MKEIFGIFSFFTFVIKGKQMVYDTRSGKETYIMRALLKTHNIRMLCKFDAQIRRQID
jgi:hypothetical protein